MLQLRPYQKDLIDQIREKFARGRKRVVLCSPTGSGKTVVFSSVVIQTISKDMFNRVLIVTDRVELFQQTWGALDAMGATPTVLNAKTKNGESLHGRVVVGMVETIKRRYKRYGKEFKKYMGQFNLIIIDEAHKGNFREIIEMYPDSFVIGATATPISTSKKNPLKNHYDDIALSVDIPDLVLDGFLSPEKSYKMDVVDQDQLVKNYSNGDFTEKSQAEQFAKPRVFDGLLSSWQDRAKGLKTLVFCVNIEETYHTADNFRKAGYDPAVITSKSTSEERAEQLQKFHSKTDGIMVNCGILTTGYDHPPIECIVMNRATMSLPLWLQCCGRGSRISPGKDQFVIIDMGGNIDRLGMWSDSRDWRDWFFNPCKPRQEQPAPVKECKKCGALMHASVRKCQYCGYEYPVEEMQKLDGELVEVNPVPAELQGKRISDLSVPELIELQRAKRYSNGFVLRILRSRGQEALREFAQIKNYKPGWIHFNADGPKSFTNFRVK